MTPQMMTGTLWIGLSVAAVFLVSLIFLTAICLKCRKTGPLASIKETPSAEYIQSPGFQVVPPFQPPTDPSLANSVIMPHTINFPSLSGGSRQQHNFTNLSESDSNRSYMNHREDPKCVYASEEVSDEEEDRNYVEVLPGSFCSTRSSVDEEPNYVNVGTSSKSGSRDYLNVALLDNPGQASEWSCESDKDSDEEGNYVNQLPMIEFQTTA